MKLVCADRFVRTVQEIHLSISTSLSDQRKEETTFIGRCEMRDGLYNRVDRDWRKSNPTLGPPHNRLLPVSPGQHSMEFTWAPETFTWPLDRESRLKWPLSNKSPGCRTLFGTSFSSLGEASENGVGVEHNNKRATGKKIYKKGKEKKKMQVTYGVSTSSSKES